VELQDLQAVVLWPVEPLLEHLQYLLLLEPLLNL